MREKIHPASHAKLFRLPLRLLLFAVVALLPIHAIALGGLNTGRSIHVSPGAQGEQDLQAILDAALGVASVDVQVQSPRALFTRKDPAAPVRTKVVAREAGKANWLGLYDSVDPGALIVLVEGGTGSDPVGTIATEPSPFGVFGFFVEAPGDNTFPFGASGSARFFSQDEINIPDCGEDEIMLLVYDGIDAEVPGVPCNDDVGCVPGVFHVDVIVAVEDICSGDEDYQDLVVFIENAKYFDLDGDDVWDAVDNCFSEDPFLLQTQIARLQNPAQANSDADPFGDSCDSCPTYPDGSDFLRDVLGDGSCPNQQEQLDPPAPCPPDGCALDATTTFLMPTTSVLPTTTNTVPRCVRLDPPCTPAVDGPLCVGGRLTLTNQIEEIAAQGPSDTLQFAAGDQVKNTIELATALNPGSTAPFSLLECQVCFEGAGVQPGTCIDGVDNDNDGEVDAADADCQTANPQELPDGVDAVGGCGGAGQPECAFAGRICSEPQLVFVTGDPAEGAQGCGPGFYKNDTQKREEVNWKPTGYSAADDFLAVFGAGPSITLLKALRQRGGGEAALLRQAVAALLNAAHPDVGYGLSEAQVTALFQNPAGRGGPEGLKDYFEALNERGCPLSARKTK